MTGTDGAVDDNARMDTDDVKDEKDGEDVEDVIDAELEVEEDDDDLGDGEEEEGEDDLKCHLCRRGTQAERNRIVICDDCERGFHQKCHLPRISQGTPVSPDRTAAHADGNACPPGLLGSL